MFLKVLPQKSKKTPSVEKFNSELCERISSVFNLLFEENKKLKEELSKHRVRISLLEFKLGE